MTRVRTKICGITSIADARTAVDAGADAIGLVFHGPSPRNVSIATAEQIAASVPAFVSVVGVVVDPADELLAALTRRVGVTCIQFHGRETPDRCRSAGYPYIKAIRMDEGVDLEAEAARYHDARALLLDAYVPGVVGGTGQRFAWQRARQCRGRPVILAGGLEPDTVADAIAAAAPYAVDVSTGVERVPGVKDPARVRAFVEAVRRSMGTLPECCPQ